MKDIINKDDITKLVNSFYEKVKKDELLASFFSHINWPNHLPAMYDFWASLLLGERSYMGAPFPKHLSLGLEAKHFDRWLQLFYQTVNENFNGEKADEVMQRANNIARVWQFKLGIDIT